MTDRLRALTCRRRLPRLPPGWMAVALAVAASAITAGGSARARPAPHAEEIPDNAITLEPLAVVYARTIVVEYERGFGHVGVHLGGAVTFGDFDAGEKSGTYLALGATLGVRFYPWSEAPSGAFVGPFGSIARVSADDGATSSHGFGWSAGAMVGWTWVLGNVFALSLGAGAAWYSYGVDGADGQRVGRDGFMPALRLAIGAAF